MCKHFQSLRTIFSGTALALAIAAIGGALPTGSAHAQMTRQPFQFRVHNNPTAANMAVIMRQVERGSIGGTTTTVAPSSGAGALSGITQYNSTTIGNMNDISTILESGAQGYISLDTKQDGSQSSQSATSEGTQVFGGNTAVGNGNPTANSTTNTTNNGAAATTGSSSGSNSNGG